MKFLILIFISSMYLLQAKEFLAPFVKFNLPTGWDCSLEGTEWVCQSDNPKVRREAIIISAAKPKGPEDSVENFYQHLTKTKKKKDLSGAEYETEVKFTKQIQINGVQWVDSLHYGSEIPGFFTRYLATVDKNVAILITYSIAKNRYKDYNADFTNLIKSLVTVDPNSSAAGGEEVNMFAGNNRLNFEAGNAANSDGEDLGDDADSEVSNTPKKQSKKKEAASDVSEYAIYGGIAVVLIGAAYFVLGRKKNEEETDEEDDSEET